VNVPAFLFFRGVSYTVRKETGWGWRDAAKGCEAGESGESWKEGGKAVKGSESSGVAKVLVLSEI